MVRKMSWATLIAFGLMGILAGTAFAGAENSMRQAIIMADGSVSIFFTRPVSLAFMVLTGIAVTLIAVKEVRKASRVAE